MYNMFYVLVICIITSIISLIITPIVKRVAIRIGAADVPSKRRMNTKVMPTIGGVAIFTSFFISLFILQPMEFYYVFPIFLAASIIIVTGVVDDIKEIRPLFKVLGILSASLIAYYVADIRLEMITLPFIGEVYFGTWSLPFSLIWIMAITNAINLIDGLDGLASGVSAIALSTMGVISYFFLNVNNIPLFITIFTLVFAIIGFLPYNFFPASIYLGDTGALFLGFMISIISLQGLKNITIISLLIPVFILGIPITDTLFAIIRRKLNKQPISVADKNHMHHRLLTIGFTHPQTVLALYSVAIIFSIIALLFPISSFVGSILLVIGTLIGIELFVEMIGLVGHNQKPLLRLIKGFANRLNKK